jgi:hypothetical protein
MSQERSQASGEQPAKNERRTDRRSFLRGMAAGVGGLTVAGAAVGIVGFRYATRTLLAGSGPYQELNWRDASFDTHTSGWAQFAHDPELQDGNLPADWKKVGVWVTDRAKYDAQQVELGGRQAVAYKIAENQVSVGAMSSGGNFYAPNPHDSSQYAVGGRVGPGDVEFVDGFWLPSQEKFVAAAAGTLALSAITSVSTIQQDFPGIRYV